jgi:HK97 family phage portal protein
MERTTVGIANELVNLFARRSIENPSTPLSDPDAWLLDLAGGMSSSGMRINRQTMMSYAAIWRCMNLIAGYVGRTPCNVMENLEGGGQSIDRFHVAQKLVRRKPNPYMTQLTARVTMQAHVLAHGNCYGYIFRDGSGRPTEILPLLPTETYPMRVNGVLKYVTTIHMNDDKNECEQRKLDASNVLHVKGLGYDGLVGYSVIDLARDSFGLGMAASKYQSKYFSNNAEPRVIIEHPADMKITAQNEFLRQWNAMHAGLENSHKTAILTQGAKVNPFSLRPKDGELISTRSFENKEIALWFGVPPHKVGDAGNASYNSLEQENQSLLDETLDFWFTAWEEEYDDKLLTEQEKTSGMRQCLFDRRALVRANLAARVSYYHWGLQDGWLSRDEVRQDDGRNPIPDGEGKKFLVALNMGEAGGGSGTGDSSATGEEDPLAKEQKARREAKKKAGKNLRTTLGAFCSDAGRRVVTRLVNEGRRAAKRSQSLAWIQNEESRAAITEMLVGPASLSAAERGLDAHQHLVETVEAIFSSLRTALEGAADPSQALAAWEFAAPDSIREKLYP